MKNIFLFSLLSLFLYLNSDCSSQASTGKEPIGPIGITPEPMPENTDPDSAALVDVHCYIQGNDFCALGIVDSKEKFWKKLWLNLQIIDANGNPLKINKDTITIVPVISTAIPPRGRSSFFATWPLSSISGTPDSIRLHEVGGAGIGPGPILLVEGISTFKVVHSNQDSSLEKAWVVNGRVINPLNLPGIDPCVNVLLYGTDNRLYFSQGFNLNVDTTIVRVGNYGQIEPLEQRGFGMNVFYESLPQPLQKVKIGKIDVLAFEKRQ